MLDLAQTKLRKFVSTVVLMKAVRKRGPGAGNPKPNKRQPFPEVNQEQLDQSMDRYVREIGVKEAFHTYAYTNLTTQQAENGRSIFKLHRMVEALVRASPTAMIKHRYLKACMAVDEYLWNWPLLPF